MTLMVLNGPLTTNQPDNDYLQAEPMFKLTYYQVNLPRYISPRLVAPIKEVMASSK